jgi:hypothetical protein
MSRIVNSTLRVSGFTVLNSYFAASFERSKPAIGAKHRRTVAILVKKAFWGEGGSQSPEYQRQQINAPTKYLAEVGRKK